MARYVNNHRLYQIPTDVDIKSSVEISAAEHRSTGYVHKLIHERADNP